jgi:hypothetical protein
MIAANIGVSEHAAFFKYPPHKPTPGRINQNLVEVF